MKNYGMEVIVDLKGCYSQCFNRTTIKEFFKDLVERIEMEAGPKHFWDYRWFPWLKKTDPVHVIGTSAVQFIRTSNITIHCIDGLKTVYLNVFSCKEFDEEVVVACLHDYFGGTVMGKVVKIMRG